MVDKSVAQTLIAFGYGIPICFSRFDVIKLHPSINEIIFALVPEIIAASLDIPKETIAHALGHGSNTVTDIYIDFDMKKVDEANRRVLDWVLDIYDDTLGFDMEINLLLISGADI